MEEIKYKEVLYSRFNQLFEILSLKKIALGEDREISDQPIVFFNEYFTLEGFEYDVRDNLWPKLKAALSEFEFFEMDIEKLKGVKKFMAFKLSQFNSDLESQAFFDYALNQFNQLQKDVVAEFISSQSILRTEVQNLLNGTDVPISYAPYRKVKWLGTQIEFCEMLVELEKKDWIESEDNGLEEDVFRTICQLFDFSLTQEKPNEKIAIDSIIRKMRSKVVTDNNELSVEFDQIYTRRYKAKFEGIVANKKPKST